MNQPGTNIKTLRKQTGMTLEELAKLTGIHYSNLSRLERGEAGYSPEGIVKIAKALGVSVGVLFEDAEAVDAAALGVRRVPVISPEQFVFLSGVQNMTFEWEDQRHIFAHVPEFSEHSFGMLVENDANTPVLQQGDIVVCDPRTQAVSGDFVLVRDQHRRSAIGRLRTDLEAMRWQLIPVNTFHAPLDGAAEEAEIMGRIIEVRRRLR